MYKAIPASCKAVVLDHANAPWAVREVPVKQPKEGEILIQSIACGVCHSDVATRKGDFDFIANYPLVSGHEVVGRVVAVGANVKGWAIGSLAGAGWHVSEYCNIRADTAVRFPETVDPVSCAPLLPAGITAFNAIRKCNVTQGDTVAICGIGGLGHLAIQYARKMGYRTVAISESEEKRAEALQLGAHRFTNGLMEDPVEALKAEGGASLIINFVSRPEMYVCPSFVIVIT
ncbi:unnamed protein product [Penicillium olsonii]|nr:unnamed protein product [Penicillium olsonii]CAG7930695.1 unnamed protein product [Penicillium olsonii]